MRKYVLDSNCYINASRLAKSLEALREFADWAAPSLYVSSVVVAELRAGARSSRHRKVLEDRLFEPFSRTSRILTPSATAWDALGRTLNTLRDREGLTLAQVSRSFAFDVLLAYTCRENGATLVTSNERDMERIGGVFAFEWVQPYPKRPDRFE